MIEIGVIGCKYSKALVTLERRSEMYYIYDGTFEGLMTVIFEKYNEINSSDTIISYEDSLKILVFEKICIETDSDKADKVVRRILEKGKYLLFRDIVYLFASAQKHKENLIFFYIKMTVSRSGTYKNYADNLEKKVDEISKSVGLEIHRMKGFVRFELLNNGILYSKIEPDNNIAAFLSNHFENRLPSEKWIIHDVKRKILIFCENGKSQKFEGEGIVFDENFLNSKDEIAKMWKKYHETIAIRERENSKLQKQFMPKRYWKYLTEKNMDEDRKK